MCLWQSVFDDFLVFFSSLIATTSFLYICEQFWYWISGFYMHFNSFDSLDKLVSICFDDFTSTPWLLKPPALSCLSSEFAVDSDLTNHLKILAHRTQCIVFSLDRWHWWPAHHTAAAATHTCRADQRNGWLFGSFAFRQTLLRILYHYPRASFCVPCFCGAFPWCAWLMVYRPFTSTLYHQICSFCLHIALRHIFQMRQAYSFSPVFGFLNDPAISPDWCSSKTFGMICLALFSGIIKAQPWYPMIPSRQSPPFAITGPDRNADNQADAGVASDV